MSNKIKYKSIVNQLQPFYEEITNKMTGENAFTYINYKLDEYGHSPFLSDDQPGFQIMAALQEMIKKNVSQESIIDLVRSVQLDIVGDILLDLTGEYAQGRVNWGFYLLDENNNPSIKIEESILYDSFPWEGFLPRKEKTKTQFKSTFLTRKKSQK